MRTFWPLRGFPRNRQGAARPGGPFGMFFTQNVICRPKFIKCTTLYVKKYVHMSSRMRLKAGLKNNLRPDATLMFDSRCWHMMFVTSAILSNNVLMLVFTG